MKAQTNSTFLADSEFNRFGIIAMVILVIGCLGGIAVGVGAIQYVTTLALVVVPTMTTLSLLLAVAPMKWIFTCGLISVIVDILMIIYFVAFT